MTARHFDKARFRAVRRAAELAQADVAAVLGVGDSTVASWENGATSPDPEKLPALARVLKVDLDELFPRTGPADLLDLRCDAGHYQYETAGIIGTKSAGPVAGAERGERRLKEKYVADLAAAYGVSIEELRRAEDRSMAQAQGLVPQDAEEAKPEGPPESLSEKITWLLAASYPAVPGPPSDAELAAGVNAHAGAQVVTGPEIQDLRTGVTDEALPVVLEGLAHVMGVSPLYFQPDAAVVRQVYEGLQVLAAARKGEVGPVRARGAGPHGLSANALSIINDLVAEMQRDQGSEE
jgi:DNA-binding XRE family transcriptional regulator